MDETEERIELASKELAVTSIFIAERHDVCIRCLVEHFISRAEEGIRTGQLAHDNEDMPSQETH